ncbi:MAG: helix-hairpin-helix domain-containing protein [Syntrophaceae bacterium]|nr:helix-hairpin-helix domain-containing protein [Syntrophaceae bacterium]
MKRRKLSPFLDPQSKIPLPHSIRGFSSGQQLILFVLAVFLLVILSLQFFHRPALPPEEVYQEIVVEVLGEVRKPGIYLFREPPTLRQVIENAGGLKEAAHFDTDSASEVLETGTSLSIFKESAEEIRVSLGRMEPRKLLVFSIPLDLNRVTAEDLCLVPGIGETLAKEIVAYRERRKGFRSLEELKAVKGIGEKKYQSLGVYFTVSPR